MPCITLPIHGIEKIILDKAVADYQNLLKEFPDDVQAKENLAFVKKKLEEQKQQQQDQKNQDSKDKDQDKKEQKKDPDKQQNKDNPKEDQGDQNPDKQISRTARIKRVNRTKRINPKNKTRGRINNRSKKARRIKTSKIILKKMGSNPTSPKRISNRAIRHKTPNPRRPRQESGKKSKRAKHAAGPVKNA